MIAGDKLFLTVFQRLKFYNAYLKVVCSIHTSRKFFFLDPPFPAPEKVDSYIFCLPVQSVKLSV